MLLRLFVRLVGVRRSPTSHVTSHVLARRQNEVSITSETVVDKFWENGEMPPAMRTSIRSSSVKPVRRKSIFAPPDPEEEAPAAEEVDELTAWSTELAMK